MSNRVEKMRKALMRANTRLLLSAVLVFQLLSLGLSAFRGGQVSAQTLVFAVVVPLTTYLMTNLLGKIFPVDRAILILVLLLMSVGLVTMTGIAKSESTPRTHAVYLAGSCVAMVIGVVFVRVWQMTKRRAVLLAALCLAALVAPYLPKIGVYRNGARNWIQIIPDRLTVQPSEFMKPVLILVLASGFSNRPRFVKCLVPIGFAAICCAILLAEHDLGAVLLYFLTTVFMYYAATSNAVLTLAGLGMGCGAAVAAYRSLEYVRDRVAIWQNPWSDPQGTGYQLVQSLIAIGSGGLVGMGLGLGSPTNVPLYHSDFVYASIAEEFGLIFAVGLLAVYVIIILRGLITAGNARTSFHSLTAFGLVVLLGLQTMLIVGGTTKLLPLTGVTLPLVAYGGSSLVSNAFSMGMLLGISSMNAEDEARDIERIALREEGVL